MKIRISPGNRKLGYIPSVSFPPVVTCAARIPCAATCYAVKMTRGPYGAAILKSYRANFELFTADRAEFFRQLAEFLQRRAPHFFRFHVSGDFIDADHMARAFDVAREFPAVRFLAFSKRHALFPRPSAVPVNFSLVASLWPNWGTRPRGFRVAYMQTADRAESRVPASAVLCPGNCETCAACWNLREMRRDVVFMKH